VVALELGRLRGVVSRRSSGGFVLEVIEDPPNRSWVVDERSDSEFPAALTSSSAVTDGLTFSTGLGIYQIQGKFSGFGE
jgi:hypothetical protein